MSNGLSVSGQAKASGHDAGEMLEILRTLKAETIGQRIRLVRTITGLTQEEFAKRAGLSREQINNYERGEKRPSINAAVAICEAHGLTLDYLYLGRLHTLSAEMRDKVVSAN